LTTTTTLDSITTADATPTSAPFKISAVPTKNQAVVAFTPTHDGNSFPGSGDLPGSGNLPGEAKVILAYRVLLGGSNFETGTNLGFRGVICGDFHKVESNGSVRCSNFNSPSGVQLTENIDYPETGGPADGSYVVNVYVLTEDQGWS
jgi:hypothetical protein